MKALLEKIPYTSDRCYNLLEYNEKSFLTPWHYHPEIELILFLEGSGTKYVGDNISTLLAGDLLLLGPNLPHYWSSSHEKSTDQSIAKSLVIQFKPDFLGKEILTKPEFLNIQALFAQSARGLAIHGKTKDEVIELMHSLPKLAPFEALTTLLKTLNCMANAPAEDLSAIASVAYQNKLPDQYDDRMRKVMNLVSTQYHDSELSLDQAVQLAGMSKAGFCRYFKNLTRKTFSNYLTEVRIGNACARLIHTQKSISEIAFECGFNHLSYFNRCFKKIKECSPKEFRQHNNKHLATS